MNRFISAADLLGATEHYNYDDNGRLARFSDRRARRRSFSTMHKKTEDVCRVRLQYNYDADSRIAAIAYSNGIGPLGNLT